MNDKISHCLACSIFRGGVQFLRPGRDYILGRSPKVSINLPSNKVSRQHAQLIWSASSENWWLKDLGSKNGSKINGNRISALTLLNDGDLIEIGPFEVRYREYQGSLDSLLAEEDVTQGETSKMNALNISGPIKPLMSGRFSGSDLVEVSQFLSFNQKTGVLKVYDRDRTFGGELMLIDGDIGYAEDRLGSDQVVIRRLLALRRGYFEFISPIPPEVLQKAWDRPVALEPMLFELSRVRDEETRRAGFG